MKHVHLALGLIATMGLAAACDRTNDETANRDEAAKKKKRKKDPEPANSGEAGADTLDLTKLDGEIPAFGGSFDMFGELTFGDIPGQHSSVEPNQFSDGWVGRESYNVLERARKGELPHKQVRTADGRVCLVFTENNIVRRAMLVRSATSPSEELAFSAAGGIIFWYANSRNKPLQQQWAYFHHNQSLERYDFQQEGGRREISTPGPYTYNNIISGARQCLQAAGASNPTPGTALTPVAPPPAPSGGYHGALALSKTASSWRISYNYGSEEQARNGALGSCSPNCEVRAVFGTGKCMSVVNGPGNYFAWSQGTDNNATAASAQAACAKDGHPVDQCVLKGTWCNNQANGTARPVAPPPAPPAPVAPPPAPTSQFTTVDASAWQSRLGPKMKAGSRVVHSVFEGPFGPSPRSLFAVTRRTDDTFWVYVMGDDNKSWPAGPSAEPGLDIAEKIVAVSFFDADGDGNLDALVMATYLTPRGAGPYYKNILLKWTPLGLRRLLNLEPKIANLQSVAAIRSKLGR